MTIRAGSTCVRVTDCGAHDARSGEGQYERLEGVQRQLAYAHSINVSV